MLWSVIRVIFKTSSVTPDFFYVFNLVLSFSTCSQSFNKICVWEVLGANVLKNSHFCCLKGLGHAVSLFNCSLMPPNEKQIGQRDMLLLLTSLEM